LLLLFLPLDSYEFCSYPFDLDLKTIFLRETFMKSLLALVLTLILTLVFSATLWTRPVINPELESLFTSKMDTVVSVMVEFKNPSFKSRKAESPVEVQKRLRQTASKVQGNLLKEITQLKKTASLLKVKSFWIDNTALVTARISFIKTLLDREEIRELYLDDEIKLFDPIKSSLKTEDMDDSTYGLRTLRAKEVWEKLDIDGTGVVVGLLDTGIDSNHPDLEGRVLKTKDFVSSYEDDVANDGHGHGTHCAGSIGGKDTSGKAIGVAPGVQFIVGKIFSNEGNSSLSQIKAAMEWIVDPDGDPLTAPPLRVISNSWGGRLGERFQAAIDTWRALGVAPIFAAGNSGPKNETIGAPGGYPNVIAIGATNSLDEIAKFSSRGPVTYQGKTYIKPDIAAPGVDVYSAKPGGGYQMMSGTSMATPHTAGVVALMLQADPNLSVDRIRELLQESAVDLGEPGMDNDFGWGRVDAYEAVTLVLSGGKVKLQVHSGGKPATIQIGSEGRIYHFNALRDDSISLPAGDYQLTIRAFGYHDKTLSVTVLAKKTLEISATLKIAPTYAASFTVKNAKGTSLNARISFPKTPKEGGVTNANRFETRFPAGSFKVMAQSVGYQTRVEEFSIDGKGDIVVIMQDIPPYLLIDRDGNAEYESYYKASLDALGLEYDYVDKISADDIMGYQNVILWTGFTSSEGMILDFEQTMLMDYVHSGGRLFLASQDTGYRYETLDFYERFLGAKYISDASLIKRIVGQGMKFKLNGGDSASNQMWPDVISVSETATDTAKVIFSYEGGGPAGLLNPFGHGKVVYFPFGFEGINGIQNRNKVMEFVTSALRPSLKDRLDRIQWAFQNNSRLFSLLINQFQVTESMRRELRSELSKRDFKVPFRALMAQTLGLNQTQDN
jgi:hypothetical protein